MSARARRAAAAGFTLLEVMVAMAILALALVAIIDGQGSAIVAGRKARTLEIATALAREKMELLSLAVEAEGFTDEKETECEEGTFSESGREDIRWKSCVVKVEMTLNLTDMSAITNALTGAAGLGSGDDEATSGSSDSTAMLAAMGLDPSMLGMALEFLPLVTESLAQAIRRVELTVSWSELGIGEQSFRLVLYVTDPSRASLGLPGMMPGADGAGAGTSGTPGAPGTSGTPPRDGPDPRAPARPGTPPIRLDFGRP